MMEMKTVASLIAYQNYSKKDDILPYLGENAKKEYLIYIAEFEGMTAEEIGHKALLEIKDIIANNYIKIHDKLNTSWLEKFLMNESAETISALLKMVPLHMSGNILQIFSDEKKDEILHKIPTSIISRKIMEILKYSIVYEYGNNDKDIARIIQSDRIICFLLDTNIDLTDFLYFTYSYEIYAFSKKFMDNDQSIKEMDKMDNDNIKKYLDLIGNRNISLEADLMIFCHMNSFSPCISNKYLLMPFIRLLTHVSSESLFEKAIYSIAYRLERKIGLDFIKFCNNNLGLSNPISHESNRKRIIEYINLYKLINEED